MAPILLLKNIPEPTAEIRKAGPAFVQKHSRIDAFSGERAFFLHRSEILFAADWYPPIIPIKNKLQNCLSIPVIFESKADGIEKILL